MITPGSNLLPPDNPAPAPVIMPADGARRWVSPDEEAGLQARTRVFVTQEAYYQVVEHATSDLENEVGGMLAGRWSVEPGTGQQFIVVEIILPARFTRQGSTFLTFTQDSLVKINTEMDECYPDKRIVGWYHTHPRMGIFLSHYDTWLHQNFFRESWQVALVIEPHTSTGGFFIRQAGGFLDPDRYFGFYEVDGKSGMSIVRWGNLHVENAGNPKGEKPNE